MSPPQFKDLKLGIQPFLGLLLCLASLCWAQLPLQDTRLGQAGPFWGILSPPFPFRSVLCWGCNHPLPTMEHSPVSPYMHRPQGALAYLFLLFFISVFPPKECYLRVISPPEASTAIVQ